MYGVDDDNKNNEYGSFCIHKKAIKMQCAVIFNFSVIAIEFISFQREVLYG